MQAAVVPSASEGSAGAQSNDVPASSDFVTFSAGPLVGKCLRFELEEIQGAAIGRKYVSDAQEVVPTRADRKRRLRMFTRKDRRPIDPPPVVICKVFERVPAAIGATAEREVPDYNVPPFSVGFVCHVDLFCVPRTEPETSTAAESVDAGSVPELNRTSELAGSTFTHGLVLPVEGSHKLLFAFTDLSVKQLGMHRLQYRCYNILSLVDGAVTRPGLAACYGCEFRVYSTTGCPALPPSTELSKHLSLLGVRINTRQSERKQPTKRKKGKASLLPSDGDDSDADIEDDVHEEGGEQD